MPSPEHNEGLRVAWLVGRLNVGGPAVHILGTASALARRGVRSLIVAGLPEPGEGDLTSEARARGLEVVTVPSLRRAVSPLRDLRALGAITAILRRYGPDVVQTQTSKAGALGRVAGRLVRAPLVVHTFHGLVFEHYFQPAFSRGVLTAERALGRIADVVAALSRAEADELRRLGVAREPLVLPVGVELVPIEAAGSARGRLRVEAGVDDDAPVCAYVGRLIEVKRIERLVSAMALARSRGGASARARLWIVGDGDRRAAVEAHVKLLGAERWVRFWGWRRDVAELYAAADVVALASRSEGTPVALIEAMAAGRGIVATAVGGVPELLGSGERGWLVPPDDEPALTQALRDAFEGPDERSRRGAAAKAHARAAHDVEKTSAALLALYEARLRRR